MNEDYKGFTIYSANKDGGGTFWYMDGVVFPEKYKSLAAAKGAITRHLNKQALPDIEVVPRTQQEIDDYGPNGIQPPDIKIGLVCVYKGASINKYIESGSNTFRYRVDHPRFKHGGAFITLSSAKGRIDIFMKPKSRNKREGGYCGRYKAGDKNFKMAHYRVGPKGEFDTLKQTARANRYFASYGL